MKDLEDAVEESITEGVHPSVILFSALSCHLEFPPDHLALTSTLSLPDSGELGRFYQFKKEKKKYAEG